MNRDNRAGLLGVYYIYIMSFLELPYETKSNFLNI